MKKTEKNMKNTINGILRLMVGAVICFSTLSACTSTRVKVNQEVAQERIKQPILLCTPLARDPQWGKICDSLGEYFNVELPQRVNGQVVYSKNVSTLKEVVTWENMIQNGVVNTNEAATIAKTMGCDSAVTIRILELKHYPPFRMVIIMLWIDAQTGNVIGRLYNDVDLSDSETNYRFKNFVGQGPAKDVYEKFFYSEDLYHSAFLMPNEFRRFVAAYSTAIMFQSVTDIPWWWFWRSF